MTTAAGWSTSGQFTTSARFESFTVIPLQPLRGRDIGKDDHQPRLAGGAYTFDLYTVYESRILYTRRSKYIAYFPPLSTYPPTGGDSR
jgi:hypothetical protein